MSLPEVVHRAEWTRARVAPLERERALTKARDELAVERRRLPMVAVIVDHYMFDREWEDGCMLRGSGRSVRKPGAGAASGRR